MKNKLSKLLTGECPPPREMGLFAEGKHEGIVRGMALAKQPGNHPVITPLSPRNHPLLKGIWKHVACMLMVLFMGIGNMWAAKTIFSATFSGSWSQTVKEADNSKVIPATNVTLSPSGVSAIAYTTRTGSTGRTASISSNAYNIAVATDLFLELVLETGTTIQKGDIIICNGTNNKDVVISDEASVSSKPTTKTNTAYVVQEGSDLINKGIVYLGRSSSSTTLTSIVIYRPDNITLNANGGTVNEAATTIVGMTEAALLPRAIKGNSRFVGWYDDPIAGTLKAGAFAKYTPNGDATLYAHYADDCASSGEIYSFVIDPKPAEDIKAAATAGSVVELVDYADCDDKGTAAIGNNSNNQYVYVKSSDGKVYLTGSNSYLKLELACPLEEGDVISFVKSKQIKLSYTYNAASGTTTTVADGVNEFTIPAESEWIGKRAIYCSYTSSQSNITSVTITRPAPAATYTVTLNPAGGAITPVPSGWTYDDVNGKYIKAGVEDGSSVDLLALTQNGYLLDGWKDSEDNAFTSSVTIDGADVELTAQWAVKRTVSFVANGGGSTMASQYYKAGATVTIPACGFTPEDGDHAFTHWAIDGVEGKTTGNPEETFEMPEGNVTLTAQWAASYGITKGAHTNGDFTIDPVSAAAGTEITLAATPDAGYLFDAWEVVKSDDTDAGVTVTNNKFTMPGFAVKVNATFVEDTRKKILYLTSATTEGDKLYEALKDDYNVTVAAPEAQTLTNYDLVVLHESIGGNTAESAKDDKKKQVILDIPTTTIPVLNTKSYFYTNARWNWGGAASGKKTKGMHVNTAYCNITSHPLFADLTPDENDSIIILSSIDSQNKPMQPVTSFTSGKEGYTLANVPDGCAIHELTPAQRGAISGKYLLISVFSNDLKNLNANGQKLFQNAAAYLLSDESWTPITALSEPAITADPSAVYAVGDNISLTASATGALASTTYTWYKGADLAAAKEAGAIQAAKTAAESGNVYEKASCAVGDAGTYWCVISNGTDCDVNASLAVTVSDISYNITFVSAHGTAPTATDGVSYTLPELSASGWAHQGWTASIDVTVDEAVVTAETTIANGKVASFGANVEFTAVWAEVFAVTFNMHDHGDAIDPQAIVDGGKVTKPADPSASGWIFGGWYKEPAYTNAWDFANDKVTAATEIHAKWTEDPCPDPKSLSKVVLTSASAGTVSGYNGDEYAGEAVIGGLNSTETAEVDASHDGVETGYKLNSGGSAIVFATLAKGTFQEGDRVVVTITKKQDAYKVEEVSQPILDIYYGTNKDDATFLTTIDNVTAAGSYTYRLTAADVMAIGTKKGIGVFRPSSGRTQNPYVYSVEIQGCRSFAIMRTVSFDMGGYGSSIADKLVEDGAKVTAPAEPVADGHLFQGWYKESTFDNEWDFANDVVDANITLYAKWADDPCTDRQSLSKVVLTAADNGTVTGYNEKEYAGAAVIASLSGTEEADIIGDATKETGYKLSSNGSSIVFATLKKGNFQEGDKLTIGITKINDQRTIDDSKNVMTIYAGSDKSHVMEVATLTGVSSPGFYTYRLTAADATAINTAGYKSIGLFRASSNGQNHHVYSVEITGCREWAVYHTLTFKNIDGTVDVSTESLAEGAYASTVAPTAPKIALKRFLGWAEAVDGTPVNLASYTITTDKILYAVYEDIDCTGAGVKFSMTPVANELSSDYQLSGTAEQSIGEYATIDGGEVYLNNNSSNNRVRISEETSAIQLVSGDEGYIHVVLDCPLKVNDSIKFDNSERLVLAHNSSKTDKVEIDKNTHFYVVPASWEDKGEFYIWRSGTGCTISGIKVIRPAKFDVSFNMMGHGSAISDLEDVVDGSKIAAPSPAPTDEDYSFAGWYKESTLENEWDFDVDVVEAATTLYAKWLDKSDATLKSLKYGSTEIELQVGVYEYNVELPSLTSSVPALTAVTNNPNATKLIANGSFDEYGDATSTVTVTPVTGAEQVYTVNFARGVALEQATVTASTEWDWSAAGVSAEIKESNTPGLSGNDVVIANVPGVKNDADFNSQALKASGTNAIRPTYFQGKVLNFKTDKEGLLIVDFGGTNGNARVLKVYDNADNEIAAWNYNSEARQVQQVVVPAGDVTLKAFEGESGNNARIYNMTFLALQDRRADSWIVPGELGTVCLKDDALAIGANIYELQGPDANNKLVFEQITSGETEAGKPYLFEATATGEISFYTKVGAAHSEDALSTKGMHGTFDNKEFTSSDANIYYFSGRNIWAVKDFTVNITIPAYRCYIDYAEFLAAPAPNPNPAPGRRRVVLGVQGTQVATGIEDVQGDNVQCTKVLIDGQLYIMYNGTMYNVQGQLVK